MAKVESGSSGPLALVTRVAAGVGAFRIDLIRDAARGSFDPAFEHRTHFAGFAVRRWREGPKGPKGPSSPLGWMLVLYVRIEVVNSVS